MLRIYAEALDRLRVCLNMYLVLYTALVTALHPFPHCPSLPHVAALSTPAFSTPVFDRAALSTPANSINPCQQSLSFRLPSDILLKRFDKFSDNITRGKVIRLSVVKLVKFLLFLFHQLHHHDM